ncbi:MAG TPA: hypothetical protein VGM98_22265, partial [Schlesneria sp.]
MSDLIPLKNFKLIPVIELEPGKFSDSGRESPSAQFGDEEWSRYWFDSLADSGIVGLQPIRFGAWYVATTGFAAGANLQIFLQRTFEEWGGSECLTDPDCRPVLNGGLVLQSAESEILIVPACCSDLGDIRNWESATTFRGDGWQVLWIGHPCISVRYQAPRLILSGQHESSEPIGRWSVCPEELSTAISRAERLLSDFADRIADVLLSLSIP